MKLACVQCDVAFGHPSANLQFAEETLAKTCAAGADLTVFPEAFLTGYCVDKETSARGLALAGERLSGAFDRLQSACDRLDAHAVVGVITNKDGVLRNTAALFAPHANVRQYHKTHLPLLGVDAFVTPGDALEVFETPFGRIGLLICYDLRIPEAARTLALKGADLIVLPTNWPEGAEGGPEHTVATRAAENHVFFAAVDRVGGEAGYRFIGRSKVCDFNGFTMAEAGDQPAVLYVDMDLKLARNKRRVVVEGRHETNNFTSRRPELYGPLVQPYSDKEP